MGGDPSQRGGTVPGTAIANTPLTLSNFSALGRERALALVTLALGGNYQTPAGAGFGQDNTGPVKPGPVDTLIDLIKTPFNVVANVFDGANQWWNDSNAQNRASSVRQLAGQGHVTPFLLDGITSMVTGASGKFDSAAIAQMAATRGINYVDMVAELYDLDPQIVGQIFADPAMTDQTLSEARRVSPSRATRQSTWRSSSASRWRCSPSRSPVKRDWEGGRWARAQRHSTWGACFARGLTVGERAAQEATTAQRALQYAGWGTRQALRINSINTAAGWSIGGLEWGIKQAAVLAGNQQVIHPMDKAMWEMPLSMNPGVNIMTAFSAHPLQALGVRVGLRSLPGIAETGLLKGKALGRHPRVCWATSVPSTSAALFAATCATPSSTARSSTWSAPRPRTASSPSAIGQAPQRPGRGGAALHPRQGEVHRRRSAVG